jgi:acetolactate synthase-1/3 small subunit
LAYCGAWPRISHNPEEQPVKRTISALARNEPGVLAKMATEFSRYAANILSLAAGETENPEISRIVACIEGDDAALDAISAYLEGLDTIIQVDDLSRRDFVDRELVMVKVAMDPERTGQLMQVFEVFRASVVGMGQETITVEMAGDQERVEGLIHMLKPYGIKSMCRSGMIALKRGDE